MPYNREKTKSLKKQKNYEELFVYLSEFAKSEIPEALNELAECYYWGLGTPIDYSQSFYYDNAAASLGNADSLAVLGFDYEHGVGVTVDQNKAVALYQQAVALGSTRGMTYLGLCFENGSGVNKDCEMAVSLYQQAAEQGYARAQRLLGLCYEKGIGIPEDKCKAVHWYKKAAEQDNKIAQRWLAMCFEYGDGVEADISQAIEWYLRAIENDDDISRVYLASIYLNEYFYDEEKARFALDYLQIAIKHLEKNSFLYCLSCYMLARYYEHGYLVERNLEMAFNYYKNAAEGGITEAMLSLANCYESGLGTAVDKVKAVVWYEKSAENITDNMDKAECYLTIANITNEHLDEEKSKQFYQMAYALYLQESEKGNAEAYLQLGLLSYKGKGCEKDYVKAFECFEKANIKLSNGRTKYEIANCYLHGFGVKKNVRKGFRLLKIAASDKEPIGKSLLLLIYCYINGIGTHKNITEAKKLMNLLSEKSEGCRDGINFYKGIIFYHGIGVKKNNEKALDYFKNSSDWGDSTYKPLIEGDYKKANLLGLIYASETLADSWGILADDKRAKKFLKLAYEKQTINDCGISVLHDLMCAKKEKKQSYQILLNSTKKNIHNVKIERLLGQHLYYGCGCKKDIVKAIEHFDSAYMSGDDIARVYMACCYAYGIGVKSNMDTAREILEDTSFENAYASNVLKGLLIYSGNWGYERNREQGLSLIKEYADNSRYNLYYTVLSSKRGDYYADLFIENHLALLHCEFEERKRFKLILPQALKLLFLFIVRNPFSENLTKKEMLRILLSQNQALIEQNKNYADNQAEMASVLGQIQINTDAIPQIIEQQKEIIELMHSIIDSVAEQKMNLPSESSLHFLDETQVEQIQSRFIEETAAKIIDSLQEKSVSVEKEEAMLKGMFGEHWLKLDMYTRKSLLSARVLFNQCKGPELASLDHSGVVVSATSALENELKCRLFTGFQTFMKNKLGTSNYAEWPELLVFRNKKGDVLLNKSFPLGSLPYLFEGSDKDKEYLSEYLNSILSEQYVDKGLLAFTAIKTGGDTFVNKCEKIRVSFRNAAAHTGLVDRTKAEACCNAIIGPNEASEKIGQVQGLLYDLAQMTENYQ